MQFKYINIILLSLFCLDSFCQSVANWRTGNEKSVSQYEVQKSIDTINWTKVATLLKGKSVYTYTLPAINYYYRIMAPSVYIIAGKTIKDTFFTRPILLTQSIVNITNAVIKTTTKLDTLSWEAQNEAQVNYYWVERSINGGLFYRVYKALKKSGKYTVTISLWGKVRLYQVYAIYKDGSKSVNVNFK